nr:immunoglobulin heavy chain junction region [Macaca mulatta]MOV53293.1 immunoglobulin heavy chain junction region [Macaca mulatta]MOV53317.1 immunoglobulin heavy chain junction region [Macaca mulatta]MOV53379.1 immunoglobulin heavy chain junction region [Macaca mulatta]MOV53403.1 immunoglobulin heavy chain junction region [Macaca mulatta]
CVTDAKGSGLDHW